MILTAIISLVMVSLYVVALTVATVFSKEETKAYYIIKKVKAQTNVQEKAVGVIIAAFKLKKSVTLEIGKMKLKNIFIRGA